MIDFFFQASVKARTVLSARVVNFFRRWWTKAKVVLLGAPPNNQAMVHVLTTSVCSYPWVTGSIGVSHHHSVVSAGRGLHRGASRH